MYFVQKYSTACLWSPLVGDTISGEGEGRGGRRGIRGDRAPARDPRRARPAADLIGGSSVGRPASARGAVAPRAAAGHRVTRSHRPRHW